MKLFLLLLTITSFGAYGSVSNVVVDGNIASTAIETMNGGSVQLGRNKVLIDTDQDNLLVNGGFEAQDVTLGWVKSTATSIDFIDSGAFEGKKSRAIRFGDTVANYRAEANRPEYVGRQARAEIYYRSPITWGANVPDICVYAGTASNIVSGTCEPLQNTGTQWYPYQKGFFWSEAVMGLVIRNNGAVELLNYVYLDKASIKLDKNESFVANIEGDKQTETLLNVGNLTLTTDLSVFSSSNKSDFSGIYSKSTQGITFLRDADVDIGYSIKRVGVATSMIATINLDGANVGANNFNGNLVTASFSGPVKKGQKITFSGGGSDTTDSKLHIRATVRSQVTVFPDETFSTSINGVYWKATACTETEIGCFNTFPYASSSNSKGAICATRPDQPDADMRVNGIRVFAKAYNSASNCGAPARVELVIGKNFATPTVNLYKDTAKNLTGGLDFFTYGNQKYGALYLYVKETGIVVFDSAIDRPAQSTSGNASFLYSDGSLQNNGYLVISASKTGLGMANVPARYVVSASPPGTNDWYEVYSDGWVRQGGYLTASQTKTLTIAFKDTLYTITSGVSFQGQGSAWYPGPSIQPVSTSTFSYSPQNSTSSRWIAEGYGASSVVKQYGAKPAY